MDDERNMGRGHGYLLVDPNYEKVLLYFLVFPMKQWRYCSRSHRHYTVQNSSNFFSAHICTYLIFFYSIFHLYLVGGNHSRVRKKSKKAERTIHQKED